MRYQWSSGYGLIFLAVGVPTIIYFIGWALSCAIDLLRIGVCQ